MSMLRRAGGFAGAVVVALLLAAPEVRGQGSGAIGLASDTAPAPRSWSLLPFAYYTPETSVSLGVLFARVRGAEDSSGQGRSSLSLNVQYTRKGQASTGGRYEGRPDSLWMILADGSGKLRWPDRLYSPGNRSGREAYEEWTRRGVDGRVRFLRRMGHPHLFVGPGLVVYHVEILNREAGGLLDLGGVRGAEDHGLLGLGVAGSWDSRDTQVYPRSGAFLLASLTGYRSFRGPAGTMGRMDVDLRRYQSVGSSVVLALRGRVVSAWGDVPFTLHTAIGGMAGGLRGIYESRYAHRTGALGVAELRFPLFWRVGGVAFGGMGEVAPDLGRLSLAGVHGAAGGGLRFTLLPSSGLNLGVDFALGEGESGLYFMLGEVF